MNLTQKISQMTPKGADLDATDLIEVSTIVGGSYVTKSITGQELIDAIPAPTGFVPDTRTLTINGVAQDLSADRSWTISTGLTVGTTPIASGTIGRVLFQGTGNVVQQSSSLFWDATNNRLGIGTSTPARRIDVLGSGDVLTGLKTTSATGAASHVVLNDVDSSFEFGMWGSTRTSYGAIFPNNAYIYGGVDFAITSLSNIKFGTGASVAERMRIVGGNGNVLIGTTTDAGFRLDVNGTARVQTSLLIGSSLISASAYPLQVVGGAGGSALFSNTTRTQALNINLTTANETRIYTDYFSTGADQKLILGTFANRANQLVLNTTGNVGINTTTDAGFRLDVNGTARVSGTITINDFVFNGNTNIGFFRTANDWNFYNISNGSVKYRITGASQGFGISDIGYDTVAASAMLQVNSTTKGFLPPRMTTTQKNAIASPAAGLMVYDTTLNVISYYNGSMWI